jgi:hypothetical protein
MLYEAMVIFSIHIFSPISFLLHQFSSQDDLCIINFYLAVRLAHIRATWFNVYLLLPALTNI